MKAATPHRDGKPGSLSDADWMPLRGWLAAMVAALAISGCATYSNSFGVIEHDLAGRQYDSALESLEKQPESRSERVLYLLNKGMVQRMKRDFVASNRSLEAAKAEMERLYDARIGERNTLPFVVNDAEASYIGEEYEQVLVHLYMALNYLELGRPDEARVEALQMDIRLGEISRNIPGDEFIEDAFFHYLAGMIYEDRGEWSDAMIAYRRAYDAYRKYRGNYAVAMPAMLKHDLLRLARREGLREEAERYSSEFGIQDAEEGGPAEQGELVFVLNNGLAPIKREGAVNQPRTSPGDALFIKLPHYESRPNDVLAARISVSGKQATTEVMEDIDAVAKRTLDSRMPALATRAMARSMLSEQTSMVSWVGMLVMKAVSALTNRADTRSWLTLPSNIQLARLPLPSGSYTVRVELLGAHAQIVAAREYPGVVIAPARRTYLTQHWIPAWLSPTRRS